MCQSIPAPRFVRRRRLRRGAAMVEAAVAIPFFILIFSGMVYIGRLYGEKQRTLREAKEGAWTHALRNCEGSVAITRTEDSGPMSDSNTHSPGEQTEPEADDATLEHARVAGGEELLENWGSAEFTVRGEVVADPILGGFRNELSTTTRVQCNEKPVKGDVAGVMGYGWDQIW